MAKNEKKEVQTVKAVFKYQCPACTNTAIETSNKMLGVSVNCKSCDKLIELNDEQRYQEL